MTFQDIALSILMALATSAATGSLLLWLFKRWVAVRIQHDYDRKLETHKAELKREQEMAILGIKTAVSREVAFHAAAHSSFAEGQKAAMERKLDAVESLWNEILALRNQLPPVFTFIDVLTVNEYKGAREHPSFRAMTEDLSDDKIVSLIQPDVEKLRPFVGEYLWTLFYCYRAILLRLALLLRLGRSEAEKLEWHKDQVTRQWIEAVLTQTELAEFDRTTFGKVSWIKQRLEAKMLTAAQQVISGASFGAESLDQATRIQERIRELEVKKFLD